MSTESILILGGSFAGLGAAHFALRHILPSLPKKDGVTYNVTVVNPSKELFWRFAAPRAIVSSQMMPADKIYYQIEPAFTYAFPKFKFIQGTATAVDASTQTVSVTTTGGEQQSLSYAALVIATGFSTPCPLFTLSTDRTAQETLYKEFAQKIKSAKRIVIGGGGPVGVETAGEIAEILNGRPGFLGSENKTPNTKVTIVTSDKQLLPVLREAIGNTAQQFLRRLGADVIYGTKVANTTKTGEGEDAKTTVELSNGDTIEADYYIDATGIRPNTAFLPKDWIDARGRVACNNQTLRVEHASAGPRVYVVGDVGSHTRGGVMDQYEHIPVAMTNLKTDLVAHLSGTAPGPDRHFTPANKEQQICPIGTQKGVGAFNGYKLPSQMVWMIKGRDYLISQLAEGTMRGDQYKKEGKWTPVQATGKAGLSSG